MTAVPVMVVDLVAADDPDFAVDAAPSYDIAELLREAFRVIDRGAAQAIALANHFPARAEVIVQQHNQAAGRIIQNLAKRGIVRICADCKRWMVPERPCHTVCGICWQKARERR